MRINPKKHGLEFESVRLMQKNIWNISILLAVAVSCAAVILFATYYYNPHQCVVVAMLLCIALASFLAFAFVVRLYGSAKGIAAFMKNDIEPNSEIIGNIVKEKNIGKALQQIVATKHDFATGELMGNYLMQQAELEALHEQINPHFLYNTLESIRGLALMNNAPDISDMIGALASMFRKTLKNSGKLVTLEEEIEFVENFILIQQFRFQGKFKFFKHFIEDVPCDEK